ncbi:hypothetical protein G6F70_001663 [Rhizopus microsporus]|nr:hypothetical protein G6F71_000155 [Rhizopus microsporus]KAG1203113.1 hypothetical protein G6F70_001663 [Rhizopus microsporus]KAG1215001.1 hypothetical protein G6F69_001402 [Rhizopus microsporus]KAG1238426.1 hypothetical protein G6F67_000410 [Rhizopus microsporus]KAG1269462.1 hypothetical protein G6F68_000281 [Rhizopus microsporus]
MERDFHNEQSSTYWLPKDPTEQQRLTGQHFAIKELYQGNVLENVRKKLDFKKGIRVLDVGCGSGAWIMDMATEYPNCVYEGCDIVEVANKRVSLQQVTFRYGNVLDRLPFEDNSFDFVHMRLFVLALQVNQWPIAINEILRVTKPGGMVQLVEFDLKMTGNEIVQQVLTGIHSACKARGQDPRIALQLEKLVSENKQATSVQSDYRSVDMASNTKTAKMFVWDWIETIKSMLPVIASKMVTFEGLPPLLVSLSLYLLEKSAMAKKAKARVILVKLLSTAGTGYNYIKSRPRIAPKLSLMKYDPMVKQHVLFTETKMKK